MSLPAELLQAISASRITCSFVVGANGEVIDAQGGSKGLGNEADLELLKTLRAHAQVVLTSGLTARIENYRMPRHADLAVFTAAGVSQLNLKPRAGQLLQVLTPPIINSYLDALNALKSRYQDIHVEFGPTGAYQIRSEIDLFVLSSLHEGAAEDFAVKLELKVFESFRLPDLFVTLAVGRF